MFCVFIALAYASGKSFFKTSSLIFSLSAFSSTNFLGAFPFLNPWISAFLTISPITSSHVFLTSEDGIVIVSLIVPFGSFCIAVVIFLFTSFILYHIHCLLFEIPESSGRETDTRPLGILILSEIPFVNFFFLLFRQL